MALPIRSRTGPPACRLFIDAINAPGNHSWRPTIASTSALRKRSTSSMKPIDGISNNSALIEAIW
jgi:hypothetical protein